MEQIYAIINNTTNKIENVIVADDEFVTTYYPGSPRIDTLTTVPAIGWSYDGTNFTPPA